MNTPGAPAGELPRFEAHGGDAGAILAGHDGPGDGDIAREVARRGFYAGTAVGAEDCAACHRDVAAQWSASAHRFSSFNNPYYRVATEAFRAEKGAVASRFCGNCHEPQLVASGAMDLPAIDCGTRAAQAGVTCLVCHSITHIDREGNGRYLADLRAVPTEPVAHDARLRPPLMAEAEFCAACHKVGLGPEITADRWLRGQNDYDAWHTSAVSGNGPGSVYRPAASQRCQDCHMPLEAAPLGDPAAKNGMIRSHRFLGANSALAHLRGDDEQERRTAENLRGRASLALLWSAPNRVDALLRARGVGHRFPGGTMDSNEVWVEITARDAAGRVIGRSGGRSGDGGLAADTHLVRTQPVDGEGRPLVRRDPQHMRGVAFDTALAPSDPQVVRFEIPRRATRVEGRLLYRKFSPNYARLACADLPGRTRRRCLDMPVVEIAAATLAVGAPPPSDPATLLDWGLALADATADHAAEARAPLEAARAAWPLRVEPLIGLGRLAAKLGQTDEVLRLVAARPNASRPSIPRRCCSPPARCSTPTGSNRRSRSPSVSSAGSPRIASPLHWSRARAAWPATRRAPSPLPIASSQSTPNPRRGNISARLHSPISDVPTKLPGRSPSTTSTGSRSRPISRCAIAGAGSTPDMPTNRSPATPTGSRRPLHRGLSDRDRRSDDQTADPRPAALHGRELPIQRHVRRSEDSRGKHSVAADRQLDVLEIEVGLGQRVLALVEGFLRAEE